MRLHYHSYSIDVVHARGEIIDYDRVISEELHFSHTAVIEIKVSNDHTVLSRTLILDSSGGTGIFDRNILIDDDCLLICVSDQVYRFKLPAMELDWKKRCDDATCFTITKFKNEYLIHGELQIARLSKEGDIKWFFSGRDIFVLPHGESDLLVEDDMITIKDWQGYKYYLDENGALIKDEREQ